VALHGAQSLRAAEVHARSVGPAADPDRIEARPK